MSMETVRLLMDAGFFGPLDVQMADLVSRMYPDGGAGCIYAAALASRAIAQGHACVDLADFAGKSWGEILNKCQAKTGDNEESSDADGSQTEEIPVESLPDLKAWTKKLKPGLFGTGEELKEKRTLFVRKDSRIYLRRFWDYERKVEEALQKLNCISGRQVDQAALDKYFKAGDDNEQKQAAKNIIERQLTLLSGGPGTGKTTTLARAVAMIAEMNAAKGSKVDIRMVAPTGKAAVRMVESIQKAKARLKEEGAGEEVLEQIPEKASASTIHSLLGSRYNSPFFKHDKSKPLAADMVIVDEASMVDLPLMAKLLDALPENCSLMLVGDVDQLASVEPGRVYGDVCNAAAPGKPLAGCLTRLTNSWRFPADSYIGRISVLINKGDAVNAWKAASGAEEGCDIKVQDFSGTWKNQIETLIKERMKNFLDARDAPAALAEVSNFRILCALRKGPHGVQQMNRLVQKTLGLEINKRFYDHQVIMVTVNTPAMNLFNGDVGVILKDSNTGELHAWFTDKDKGARSFPVNLLPEHETAFAMTIHKSQGSEFPYVAMILPDNDNSSILTRELLYTGITRVRIERKGEQQTGQLYFWCTEASFKKAVITKTSRSTGLFS